MCRFWLNCRKSFKCNQGPLHNLKHKRQFWTPGFQVTFCRRSRGIFQIQKILSCREMALGACDAGSQSYWVACRSRGEGKQHVISRLTLCQSRKTPEAAAGPQLEQRACPELKLCCHAAGIIWVLLAGYRVSLPSFQEIERGDGFFLLKDKCLQTVAPRQVHWNSSVLTWNESCNKSPCWIGDQRQIIRVLGLLSESALPSATMLPVPCVQNDPFDSAALTVMKRTAFLWEGLGCAPLLYPPVSWLLSDSSVRLVSTSLAATRMECGVVPPHRHSRKIWCWPRPQWKPFPTSKTSCIFFSGKGSPPQDLGTIPAQLLFFN